MGRTRRQAFTNPIRCKTTREAPAHLKSFPGAPFLVPPLEVGDTDAQLEKVNPIGFIGPKCSRGQVATVSH